MFTARNYDEAVRIVFMDNSIEDSNGFPILKILPFSLVTIAGEDYMEVHSELTSANDGVFPDQQVHQSTLPNRFTRIQNADVDNPGSYNPSNFQPVFQKHRGV